MTSAAQTSIRRIDPWVGERYWTGLRGDFRLLIVGDSHYCDSPESAALGKTFTSDVVRKGAIERRWPFFEHIRETALGMSQEQAADQFWNRVCFANLVQDILPESTAAPTPQQFETGWLALRETVDEYAPHLLLMYTVRGWQANVHASRALDVRAGAYTPLLEGMGAYPRRGGRPLIAAVLNHPRNSGVSRSVWRAWAEQAWLATKDLADQGG